nr:hypothetical protein [Tanacetum cinerariifolium]
MQGLFDKQSANWFKPFIAHELGHYYFGTYKVFNSVLGDALSEGLTEYSALALTKSLFSDSVYQQKLRGKLKALKDFKAVPFANVTSGKSYENRELYVYYYTPIVFTAIQHEIGEEQMWRWLRTILTTPAERTDYLFLLNTLKATLPDQNRAKEIAARYFEDSQSLVNAIEEIKRP